jgi:hypothetical protein
VGDSDGYCEGSGILRKTLDIAASVTWAVGGTTIYSEGAGASCDWVGTGSGSLGAS